MGVTEGNPQNENTGNGYEPQLKEIWKKVKEKHFFPELPEPAISDSMENAALKIKSKKIVLSRSFIERESRHLSYELVIEALLDHAVAHYTYCPWNFSTHLKLYSQAKKVLKDKELAQKASSYFMDVAADTHCFKEKKTPLPDLYRNMEKGYLDKVFHSLYQIIWGEDLNAEEFKEGSREASSRLSRIPYLDRLRWSESILRFSKIFKELIESEEHSEGRDTTNPMGENDFDRYSPQEIEQGLKELAKASADPQEFRDVVSDLREELDSKDSKKTGLGPGHPIDADTLYYMKLAENFSIPIRKTPLKKSGSLYPHSHIPWELDKPYRDIDPWTSFGKIMPGITQSWNRKEGETLAVEDGIPECIVMIDSSGSMTNPKHNLSYAVLGAACAADAYIRNNARVSVYNFSDVQEEGKLILDYTRDRRQIYKVLCHYFGGGTRLDTRDINQFQKETLPDIFIVTDMQISNLEELIGYFNRFENRITAVHIGDNWHVDRFKDSMEIRGNVCIYRVGNREDIPKIILGKVKELFKHR